MGPHVALDAVQVARKRGELRGQGRGEDRLLVAQRGGRVAAVHGDGGRLHRGDHKGEPGGSKSTHAWHGVSGIAFGWHRKSD